MAKAESRSGLPSFHCRARRAGKAGVSDAGSESCLHLNQTLRVLSILNILVGVRSSEFEVYENWTQRMAVTPTCEKQDHSRQYG